MSNGQTRSDWGSLSHDQNPQTNKTKNHKIQWKIASKWCNKPFAAIRLRRRKNRMEEMLKRVAECEISSWNLRIDGLKKVKKIFSTIKSKRYKRKQNNIPNITIIWTKLIIYKWKILNIICISQRKRNGFRTLVESQWRFRDLWTIVLSSVWFYLRALSMCAVF